MHAMTGVCARSTRRRRGDDVRVYSSRCSHPGPHVLRDGPARLPASAAVRIVFSCFFDSGAGCWFRALVLAIFGSSPSSPVHGYACIGGS